MRLEDMTPEMIEKAKRCETSEERLEFMAENGIELTDEQLEGIAGGHKNSPGSHNKQKKCPVRKRNDGDHNWEETGRTRPGRWIGIVDDVEKRCTYCGKNIWALW